MIITISKNKTRIYLGTLLFILSGYFFLIFGQVVERVLLILSLPFFYKEFKSFFYKANEKKHLVHHLFVGCMFIDIFLFMIFSPIVYAFGMFYVWLLTVKIFPMIANKIGAKFYTWIYKVNLYISVFILLISYLIEPIKLVNYSGLFGNPNGFGNHAALTLTFIFPILIEKMKNGFQRLDMVFLIGINSLCLLSVVISSSRTAFLTVVIEMCFFCILLFHFLARKSLKKKHFKRVFLSVLLLMLLISLLILFTDIIEVLNNAMFNKFVHLSDDPLNGREEYWQWIWENSDWFEDGVKDIGAAHNVYFGLIDQFGKCAGILYLVFIILNLVQGILGSFKKNSGFWDYCFVFSVIAFLAVSMTENYLLTNTMLWFYMMIPIKEIKGSERNR